MAKASDNVFPRVILGLQTTDQAAPSDSSWRTYAKADGIYARSSNSTVGPFGASGGVASVVTAHGCRIKRASGNVSVGNNTLTVITFDAEDFDTDSMHDNSSNTSRITIPSISGVTTGLWSFTASGYSNATTRLDAALRKNANTNPASGTILQFVAWEANNSVRGFLISTMAVLSSGDYVELFIRSTGATGQVTFEADDSPIMTAAFLGKVT